MKPALLLLLALLPLAGAEVTLALSADATVLPDDLYRLSVSASGEIPDGPAILHLHLTQGRRLLATERIDLVTVGQLQNGITVHLPVPADLGAEPVDCRAELLAAGSDTKVRASVQRPTWLALVSRLAALGPAAQSASDALPGLWLEQGLAAVRGQADQLDAERLRRTVKRLQAWQEHGTIPDSKPGTSVEGGYRCPIDGSIQPYRWHRASEGPRAVVVVLAGGAQPGKEAWEPLPAAWLAAARQAHIDLLAWYPAGDASWSGVSLQRLQLALPNVLADLDRADLPRALCGVGPGASGALRAIGRIDGHWRGALLLDPVLAQPPRDAPWPQPRVARGLDATPLVHLPIAQHGPADAGLALLRRQCRAWITMPAAPSEATPWLWLLNQATLTEPPPRPSPRPRPLDAAAYANGPFVIIVGTRESQAARESNERTALAFRQAWAAHAHGAAPQVDDVDWQARDWPDHHLVLIGNPQSNAVLSKLADDLPLRWSHRAIRHGDISVLRPAPATALLVEHGKRHRLIIDGPYAPLAGSGLPLAGFPALSLGTAAKPPLQRSADSLWHRPAP